MNFNSFTPDAAFQHPVTVDTDCFRHRMLAQLMDGRLNDKFSWEATYDGELHWIEQLYAAYQKHPSSHLLRQLKIAIHALDHLIIKIEFPIARIGLG